MLQSKAESQIKTVEYLTTANLLGLTVRLALQIMSHDQQGHDHRMSGAGSETLASGGTKLPSAPNA
jgi:hypothetical protein